MSTLIARLKVASAVQQKPTASKAQVKASIKIPGATTAKVAPVVEQVGGKTVATKSGREDELVLSGIRNKLAESKPKIDIGTNEEIIAKYRDEYQQFLKELETMDFSSQIFGQSTVNATVETKPTAPVAKEEVPLANGISVGEEAGESIVIPTTPKKTRKKKAVTEEVQIDPTEKPTEE